MNYITHLTGFFDRVAKDTRLNSTHISMYMAIFQLWNLNRFKSPISISRSEVMELSKVSSKNTYHKCIKELHLYSYLRYEPSYHPLRGSWVYLFDFKKPGNDDQLKIGTGAGLAADKQEGGDIPPEYELSSETRAGTGSYGALNKSKHIKHSKQEREETHMRAHIDEKSSANFDAGEKKIAPDFFANESSSQANQDLGSKQGELPSGQGKAPEPCKLPGSLEEVKVFFAENQYPPRQALKFFHHYNSNGWKIGGKTTMENWESSAHKWMLNEEGPAAKSSTSGEKLNAKQLHTNPDKDYSEPL